MGEMLVAKKLSIEALLVVAVGLAAWFLLPHQMGLLTRIIILALLALSANLVINIAGLPTLGQAAFFGAGAYASALCALHLSSDPLLGLLVGGVVGALVALVSGAIVLRFKDLTFLMLSIAVAEILAGVVRKAQSWTGGDDGLTGYANGAILGVWDFDWSGRVGALYSLAILVVAYWFLSWLIRTPFGMSVQGLKGSVSRMRAIGISRFSRLLILYAVSGFVGGVAGALSAQTTFVVAMDSFGFALSADVLIIVILGGGGKSPMLLVAALLFVLLEHSAAAIDPYNWLFAVGILLMGVVVWQMHANWWKQTLDAVRNYGKK